MSLKKTKNLSNLWTPLESSKVVKLVSKKLVYPLVLLALITTLITSGSAQALTFDIRIDSSERYFLTDSDEWGCVYNSYPNKIIQLTNGEYKNTPTKTARAELRSRLALVNAQIKSPDFPNKAPLFAQRAVIKKLIKFVSLCSLRKVEEFDLTYDAQGVPHIKAKTDRGMFFGMGYTHASQRLFQMAFLRLKIEGRLAEFMGASFGQGSEASDLISSDKKFRTYGYARKAKLIYPKLSATTKKYLSAYADGVNKYISEVQNNLPMAFTKVGITNIPAWMPHDALTTYLGFAHLFISGGEETYEEEAFERDVATLGQEAALNKWLNPVKDWDSAIVKVDNNLAINQIGNLGAHLPITFKASHNWVVAGDKNSSGKPVHVGLPQLPVDSRILHPMHLSSPNFNVMGAGFAGSIGFLIGFNDKTSWSVTSLTADLSDLVKLVPNGELRYIVDGKSKPYKVRSELIFVKNGSPINLTVRESIFGPVVNDFIYNPKNETYALRSVALYNAPDGRKHPVQGLIGLMKATDMNSLLDSAWRITYPSVHMLLSSNEGTHGKIGYMAVSGMPVRASSSILKGILPQDGSSRNNDWQGLLSKDKTPHKVDPVEGFIVTGNNLATNDRTVYGYGGVGLTDRAWQATRKIEQLISGSTQPSPEDISGLRLDCGNPILSVFTNLTDYLLANHPNLLPNSKEVESVQALLKQTSDLNITQPYGPLALNVLSIASTYFRPTPMSNIYGKGGGGLIHLLRKFEINPEIIEGEYLNDIATYVSKTLIDAWNLTIQSPSDPTNPGYGTNPEQWLNFVKPNMTLEWSKNMTLQESLDDRANIETGLIECQSSGTLRSQPSNIYTQITVEGHRELSQISFAPGTSDDPNDPHFQSQLNLWEQSQVYSTPLDYNATASSCAGQTACSTKKIGFAFIK
jgi:acyl-homoserine lactone acylase PvdQ